VPLPLFLPSFAARRGAARAAAATEAAMRSSCDADRRYDAPVRIVL
jgi:hypothetical protein